MRFWRNLKDDPETPGKDVDIEIGYRENQPLYSSMWGSLRLAPISGSHQVAVSNTGSATANTATGGTITVPGASQVYITPLSPASLQPANCRVETCSDDGSTPMAKVPGHASRSQHRPLVSKVLLKAFYMSSEKDSKTLH